MTYITQAKTRRVTGAVRRNIHRVIARKVQAGLTRNLEEKDPGTRKKGAWEADM
jgi:hypothetical protein